MPLVPRLISAARTLLSPSQELASTPAAAPPSTVSPDETGRTDAIEGDGWASRATGLGQRNFDPAVDTQFEPRELVPYWEAVALYAQGGIARKVIDIPVDDATRAGVTVEVENNPDLGPAIDDYRSQIPVRIDRLTRRRGDLVALNAGEKYARAFRGAVILVGINDGGAVSDPVEESSVQSVEFLRLLTRRQVTAGPIDRDPASPWHGLVSHWTVTSTLSGGSARWHASRVIPLPGFSVPDDSASLATSDSLLFGVSLYDIAYRELRGMGTTEGAADALIQRSTILAILLGGLSTAARTATGLSKLKLRMLDLNRMLSSLRLLVLDRDNEDVKEVGYRWTGLAEMLQRNKSRVAAAVDIPVTRLFGESMTGLAGDSLLGDRLNYLEGNVRGHVQATKLTPPLTRIVDLIMLAADGPTAGVVHPYTLSWGPVIEPTQKERAELESSVADTVLRLIDAGIITAREAREALFAGPSMAHSIAIDTSGETPDPPDPPSEDDNADPMD